MATRITEYGIILLHKFRVVQIEVISRLYMCWKYFDECFMDKNLLHISLTKFNKLNKRRKRTF